MKRWIDWSLDWLLVWLLKRLTSPFPPNVFYAISEKVVLCAIEAVVLREHDGVTEILLTRRPHDDAFFPDQEHSPGTIFRSDDKPESDDKAGTYDRAFARLEQSELGLAFTEKKFAGTIFLSTPRGRTVCLVYICAIAGEPKEGRFWPVNALPHNLVACHRLLIAFALKQYIK